MQESPTISDILPLESSGERPVVRIGEMRKREIPRIRCCASVFFCLLLSSLLISVRAQAQVALDASTSGAALLTTVTNTVTLAHTSTGSNLVLVVGISMDIFNGGTATVSSVTYNSVSLTKAGSHNDSVNQRRTEMWYLIAPAAGNNNVVVTVNVPAASTIGTVVGATTFTGADQTSPIRTYASNDGNTNAPYVDVASGTNDIVLDTMATAGNRTVTSASGTQVRQWALSSGITGFDVYGYGSSHGGAASVPMAENLSASSQWSVSAVSVQPLQADLGVTVAGSATQFPANLTYTVTVKNNGPSVASGVVLTDTLASGLIFVSSTPSQGSCSGTSPITCNLGAIAVGATATVTVTATPTSPGGYINSASVTATTADLNTANNSANAISYSELTECATSTLTAGGNLSGTLNTYYPGTATASVPNVTGRHQ